MINYLPNEILGRLIAASYREVITRVCKHWNTLGGKIKCPTLRGQREVFRPDLYSWFQAIAHAPTKPTFSRFDAAVEYKNWPAAVYEIYGRHDDPASVVKAVADLVYYRRHKKIEALITTFPGLVPTLSINDIRNYNDTAEMMYEAGYIVVKSPLILELLEESYLNAVKLICERSISPDECELSAETILSIIARVNMPKNPKKIEGVIFGLRELAAMCLKLLSPGSAAS